MLKLWSLRFTPAKGWHWKMERDCATDSADQWVAMFQADEPHVQFKVSAKQPKVAK